MNSTSKAHQLTRAEAAKMIRKAPTATRFALHVSIDLPIDGTEDQVFAGGGFSHLILSRKDALRLVQSIVSDGLEARGARIPLTVRDFTSACGVSTTYWIG